MAQNFNKLRKKLDEHYIAVLRNPTALVDEWRCPICKKEFKDQDACPHGWPDVAEHNNKFLIKYMRNRHLDVPIKL